MDRWCPGCPWCPFSPSDCWDGLQQLWLGISGERLLITCPRAALFLSPTSALRIKWLCWSAVITCQRSSCSAKEPLICRNTWSSAWRKRGWASSVKCGWPSSALDHGWDGGASHQPIRAELYAFGWYLWPPASFCPGRKLPGSWCQRARLRRHQQHAASWLHLVIPQLIYDSFG